jgi:hypothetical protein
MTNEEAQLVAERLQESELFIVVPAYYAYRVVNGRMPMDVVRQFAAYAILPGEVVKIGTRRDRYRPDAKPDDWTVGTLVCRSMWRDDFEAQFEIQPEVQEETPRTLALAQCA